MDTMLLKVSLLSGSTKGESFMAGELGRGRQSGSEYSSVVVGRGDDSEKLLGMPRKEREARTGEEPTTAGLLKR
jgi:hypothetical protein